MMGEMASASENRILPRANKIRKSESIILPDSIVQTLEQNKLITYP